MALQVVKVGGSLFDLPDLGPRLRAYLACLPAGDKLIVPGGGAAATVVRALDRDHRLGQQAAHWLALRACALNAHFLAHLLPRSSVLPEPQHGSGLAILDPLAFLLADEGRPGCLPHHWDVTSDSVAARAAVVAGGHLVLLKSISLSTTEDWLDVASAAGHVDPFLPSIVRQEKLLVTTVNLRCWPD